MQTDALVGILGDLDNFLPLDKVIGVYLIGTFIGLTLYGVSLHQLYRYYCLFPSDDSSIRVFVVVVMILETVHTAMTMHTCYYWTVLHYFDILALIEGVWSLSILPVVASATVFCSQIFFARRVFLIGSLYRPIVGIAMLCIVAHFAFATDMAFRAFNAPSLVTLVETDWPLSAAFGMGLLADIMFTATLTFVLRRSRAGLRRKDGPLDLVVIYVINTGLLHCVFNAFSFLTNLVFQHSLIYVALNVIAVRLYAISLFSVLNSRETLARKGMEFQFAQDQGDLLPLNFIARAARQATTETWNVPQVPDALPAMIDVKVTTEQEGWSDTDLEGYKRGRVSV